MRKWFRVNTETRGVEIHATETRRADIPAIDIPEGALSVIGKLEAAGFNAYAVGGCVRDSLLGKEPKDWDICTSALPQQVLECFQDCRVIETGLKHGTVTIMIEGFPYEVTTFRIDGDYSDNRRPDSVEFTDTLKEDLSRRDFTINAMAYNPKSGIVDFFDGMADLKTGRIRCVGDPDKRFCEDALRIMRALRFAAVLGFSIEDGTAKAMHENRSLLANISVERISAELNKLIVGKNIPALLLKHVDIITEIIPELIPAIGFKQNTPYHCYDVFRHTLYSVESAPRDVHIRLTMLFHDIGKPSRYTEADGVGHFYGHAKVSADMAGSILKRLKYDNDTIETVTQLIIYHDAIFKPRRKQIKRWLNKIGEARFRQLVEVKKADAMAQALHVRDERVAAMNEALAVLDEILEKRLCFSLKDLAIDGRDLIAIGVPEGARIGAILNRLVLMVIDEEIENDKAALLDMAKRSNSIL